MKPCIFTHLHLSLSSKAMANKIIYTVISVYKLRITKHTYGRGLYTDSHTYSLLECHLKLSFYVVQIVERSN